MEDVFDVNPKIVFENHIFTMKIFFLGVNELNKKNHVSWSQLLDTSQPEHNGCYFADDIFWNKTHERKFSYFDSNFSEVVF